MLVENLHWESKLLEPYVSNLRSTSKLMSIFDLRSIFNLRDLSNFRSSSNTRSISQLRSMSNPGAQLLAVDSIILPQD